MLLASSPSSHASVPEFSSSALIAACVSAETFKPRALARSAKSSGTYTFNLAIHTNIHTASYAAAASTRHIGEPRQMQLMGHGHCLGRAVAMLGENQVGLAAARVVALECIRPVEQDNHVGILFKRVMD